MKRLPHYLPSLLSAGLVFCLSVMQSPLPDSGMPQGLDKIAHLCMYAALAFVFSLDCRRDGCSTTAAFWFPLVAASLYGGAMELVQAYLTTCRSGDWVDFEADVVGALLGVWACMGLNWRLNTYSK
jgi:VanZ family protein